MLEDLLYVSYPEGSSCRVVLIIQWIYNCHLVQVVMRFLNLHIINDGSLRVKEVSIEV
jgi:hypothetical protein